MLVSDWYRREHGAIVYAVDAAPSFDPTATGRAEPQIS
jgi:hypothetical protein